MSDTPPSSAVLSSPKPEPAPAELPQVPIQTPESGEIPKEQAAMLDVHPAHHAAGTWRDFFVHIATASIRELAMMCSLRMSDRGGRRVNQAIIFTCTGPISPDDISPEGFSVGPARKVRGSRSTMQLKSALVTVTSNRFSPS
jgi:hypothetical protein